MDGEKDVKPNFAEIVLIVFVVSLTFEEINQVTIYDRFEAFYII